jgi:hypothetical protein
MSNPAVKMENLESANLSCFLGYQVQYNTVRVNGASAEAAE